MSQTRLDRGGVNAGDPGLGRFIRRAFAKGMGYSDEDLERPIIGICNSESELNHCNSHLGTIAEAVKRGVWQAGGLPMEFPTISIFEIFTEPTSMLYRNLMAMDAEEMIRGQPLDGVVLLAGCDKTTPAYLMGAASADVPALMVTGGPMLSGRWQGHDLGACTDCRRYWTEYRADAMTEQEMLELENSLIPSTGHCMVMGTASTMASMAEAMGMTLPGCAAIPAPYSARLRLAEASGRRIVEMVREELRPSQLMTKAAFENAIRVCMALGGSTNAVVHLPAIAGRLGIDLPLELFDQLSRETPVIANMRPSGKYQMEDLYEAGGIPAIMKELEPLLDTTALTATGKSLGDNLAQVRKAELFRDIVKPLGEAIYPEGGIAILRGNIAPNGAVIKHAAATPRLLKHTGRAVVFASMREVVEAVNDPELDVTPDDILVMQNAGPIGGPGMPESGFIPIPKKLLQQGVRDMVRISDARMSGTAFGTIVLHVAPEAAVGGPLAAVRTGDMIELDVQNRKLNLLVSDEEIRERLAHWKRPQPAPAYRRGYGWLYVNHVLQADKGCDFDFLTAGFG
ncbi:MAG: dihydroxy-acid dehydratase [Actinobacteria bacterium]|nr:dihydroxy-acid dehydratase [Actinomycetota bacterium]